MSYDEASIRKHALTRLAGIFGMSELSLVPTAQFGRELKATSRSDFQRNEFDVIDDDIKDVADRQTRKALADGILTISTVKDYCDHMVRCNAVNPSEVGRILGLAR